MVDLQGLLRKALLLLKLCEGLIAMLIAQHRIQAPTNARLQAAYRYRTELPRATTSASPACTPPIPRSFCAPPSWAPIRALLRIPLPVRHGLVPPVAQSHRRQRRAVLVASFRRPRRAAQVLTADMSRASTHLSGPPARPRGPHRHGPCTVGLIGTRPRSALRPNRRRRPPEVVESNKTALPCCAVYLADRDVIRGGMDRTCPTYPPSHPGPP